MLRLMDHALAEARVTAHTNVPHALVSLGNFVEDMHTSFGLAFPAVWKSDMKQWHVSLKALCESQVVIADTEIISSVIDTASVAELARSAASQQMVSRNAAGHPNEAKYDFVFADVMRRIGDLDRTFSLIDSRLRRSNRDKLEVALFEHQCTCKVRVRARQLYRALGDRVYDAALVARVTGVSGSTPNSVLRAHLARIDVWGTLVKFARSIMESMGACSTAEEVERFLLQLETFETPPPLCVISVHFQETSDGGCCIKSVRSSEHEGAVELNIAVDVMRPRELYLAVIDAAKKAGVRDDLRPVEPYWQTKNWVLQLCLPKKFALLPLENAAKNEDSSTLARRFRCVVISPLVNLEQRDWANHPLAITKDGVAVSSQEEFEGLWRDAEDAHVLVATSAAALDAFLFGVSCVCIARSGERPDDLLVDAFADVPSYAIGEFLELISRKRRSGVRSNWTVLWDDNIEIFETTDNVR